MSSLFSGVVLPGKVCHLKTNRTKNVLWTNKNLKNITLRRGYTGIIFLKTFSVNIFKIYATQHLGYCLMEKIWNFSYKNWQRFFFTQRKRKTYDANDLLVLGQGRFREIRALRQTFYQKVKKKDPAGKNFGVFSLRYS